MKIEVETLKKMVNGWDINLQVDLTKSQIDRDALNRVEDWKVTFKDNKLYLEVFMDNTEPWEDEPLEELVKAAKMEIEWKLNQLLV
ncbi:MAG: hypothetical protein Q8N08_00925 [Methanobacteriaceae archaeon]|nr:hypothetical protein [Methanobacteriaceae archaeon]